MFRGILSILLVFALGVLCPLTCQGALSVSKDAPAAGCCPRCSHHAPAGESPDEAPSPGQDPESPAGDCICSGAVNGERVDVAMPLHLAVTILPVPVMDLNRSDVCEAASLSDARQRTGPVPLYCLLSAMLR